MSPATMPAGRRAANDARLRGCDAPHQFRPVPPGPGETAVRRFICVHCRGVVDVGHAAGRAEAMAEFRVGAAGGWGAP